MLQAIATPSGSGVKMTEVQHVCMEVVRQSCGDSVLEVFLASLVSGMHGWIIPCSCDEVHMFAETVRSCSWLLCVSNC